MMFLLTELSQWMKSNRSPPPLSTAYKCWVQAFSVGLCGRTCGLQETMSSPKCYFCFSHFQSAKGRIKICRIQGKGALKYPILRQSVKPNLLGLKENCFVLFCLFFLPGREIQRVSRIACCQG